MCVGGEGYYLCAMCVCVGGKGCYLCAMCVCVCAHVTISVRGKKRNLAYN